MPIQRLIGLCAAIACAVLVASCGTSSQTSSTASQGASQGGSATGSASATTPAATTGPATSPATTSATTSAPAEIRPPACRASDFALAFLGGQAGLGHGELGFALHNVSAKRCHTYGYPGIQFLDRAGRPLPTVPTRTTQDYFGSTPLAALVVAPGARVSFRLGVTHGIASSAGCATAYGLQVIPPDDTATVRTAIPNGAFECRAATVSPLRPDESAYP